jgi:DNA-binding transcriptional ArsR family regulator
MNIPQLDHFQVIADASRRQMLHLLSKESLSINSLAENFDISRPAVSKHVAILCDKGFISIEVKGRERLCTLKQQGFKELHEWISYYDKFWNEKLNNLNTLLNKHSKKKK